MGKTVNVREFLDKSKSGKRNKYIEKSVPIVLFLTASISVLTTIGILFTLVFEAVLFFKEVPFIEFYTGKVLKPLGNDPSFGILPLMNATILTTLIAMLVAIPIGLTTAIFLSEYASERVRKKLKPIIEVLAGIPTIVFGFFALTFVTPILRQLIPALEPVNALSPGIVMGIMIIPLVASLSEDAMSAVPNSMREGAFALGATKFEVTMKVVIPAAISGIVASFVLAISRAIGETMIVAIASGSNKVFTLDITQPMQTMTAYIVEFTSGDAGSGTVGYYSLYAVGLTLFIFTLVMNLVAQYISRKFREEY
ncbi:phosphate ABC transporter permease subunit PstC [Calidifontibacillus oryziterrae]|uniref:phosphate ABC transporter permease subunit PstC n=1 Tax=Calidifontibacillus oryziterrae TaxID=1191699 RepID=UPI0002F8FC71|nr:phosphate ABC transporter permease subunit PstC [Calidifontibacillus oryziterrae]